MSKKSLSRSGIDIDVIREAIVSIDGIHSANVQAQGLRIKEIHLLTSLYSTKAVKAVRTAVYVKAGYLIDKDTLFRVARV